MLALVLTWAWMNRTWLALPPVWQSGIEQALLPEIDRWQHRRPSPLTPGAVLFGDSLASCGEGASVGGDLWTRLEASGRPMAGLDVTFKGFRPLQFYYLLDDVLAGEPVIALVEVNPGFLWPNGPPWQGIRFLNLSRRLSLARAVRVRAALAADGLTLFDPWIFLLEEKLDALYLVAGIQERWRTALEHLSEVVTDASGLTRPNVNLLDLRALEAATERGRNANREDLPRHPMTVVLRALYQELRQHDVMTLFYVPPVHATGGGHGDEAALRRTLEAVRIAVGAAPEEWLDLHALAPPGGFRDYAGHLFPQGCSFVADELQTALMPRLAARY